MKRRKACLRKADTQLCAVWHGVSPGPRDSPSSRGRFQFSLGRKRRRCCSCGRIVWCWPKVSHGCCARGNAHPVYITYGTKAQDCTHHTAHATHHTQTHTHHTPHATRHTHTQHTRTHARAQTTHYTHARTRTPRARARAHTHTYIHTARKHTTRAHTGLLSDATHVGTFFVAGPGPAAVDFLVALRPRALVEPVANGL